ncbi:MAG: dUTP diphosphatase [Pseudomonadales bacterium]
MSLDRRAADMLRTMADMQEAHNRHVHPDWRTQGYDYYRAIWVECAELLDHFGWKWWKHQDADLDQVKLEIVDIWHFALSDLLRAEALTDELAALLVFEPEAADGDPAAFRAAVERLALTTLAEEAFVMEPFAAVMRALPMGFGELFRLYVGKNVLNNFRQDHGYKTGDYHKLWQGREDNEHLVEILESLSCDPEDVPANLYRALQSRYPA